MPPYRRNRWIIGGFLRPLAMIGAAYAYTKPYSYGKKVKTFFITWMLLELVVGLFVVFVLKQDLRVFEEDPIYTLVIWIFAYPVLLRFWRQLPEEDKKYGW